MKDNAVYLRIPVKCGKCGRTYIPERAYKKCPHNLRDKLARILAGQNAQ